MISNVELLSIADTDINIRTIYSIQTERKENRWRHNRQIFSCDALILILDGEFYAHIDDKEFIVKNGDLLYVPKNAEYFSESRSTSFSFRSIYFELDDDSRDKFFLADHYIHELRFFDKFKKLFEHVMTECISKTIGYKLKVRMILYDILRNLMIEQTMANNIERYYTIKNAINYINQNYMREFISIDELSKMCDITPTHFTRVFKKIYSITPKKYIVNIKISKAMELLQNSTYSIKEISAQLGYSSPAYFSAAFKDSAGMSPIEYRMQF